MQKRGQLVLKAIIVLLVAGILIVTFPKIGKSFGTFEAYKKAIASREIALILDTLYAYPYDSVIYYNEKLEGLTIEVSENKVKVFSSGYKADPTRAEYNYLPTGTKKINAVLENPKRIRFEKKGDTLTLTKE